MTNTGVDSKKSTKEEYGDRAGVMNFTRAQAVDFENRGETIATLLQNDSVPSKPHKLSAFSDDSANLADVRLLQR